MARSFFMQFRLSWFLMSAALVNVLVLLYLSLKAGYVPESVSCSDTELRSDHVIASEIFNKSLDDGESSITFIIREFEDFKNDVYNTTLNLRRVFKKSRILVIADSSVYPPLMLEDSENVHLINLRGSVDEPVLSSRPDSFIKSEYVVIIPDAVRVSNRFNIVQALKFFLNHRKINPAVTMAVWPLTPASAACGRLNVNLKQWTLDQEILPKNSICDTLVGSQAVLLLASKTLLNLPYPYQRPYQPTIFIQNSIRRHKVAIDWNDTFFYQSSNLFENDPHKNWKYEKNEKKRRTEAFHVLGIKHVHHATGIDEWYGCAKETPRCFGTVVNDMPEFIYQNRWTPPCCLRALRLTVRHVFKILSDQGVRFWLEGGSLLGAMRDGDIIPWDYDVDIGIYQDDIAKSFHLSSCHSEAFEDEEGFVWEKASEGDFFRVQYSQRNHLHVDIFPFYSVDGIMTKNTWFKTHRQDREFPETFLQPLETISFAGIQAPVPNNARKFLEFKFGDGVIENPKYPNAKSV